MSSKDHKLKTSRRSLLKRTATVAAAASIGAYSSKVEGAITTLEGLPKVASKGNINQSLVHWCYRKYWSVDEMCQLAVKLGCKSIELISPEHWPILKKYGLTCAIAGSHGFTDGMNTPKNHKMCITKIKKSIDACAEYKFPSVISFTGFANGLSLEEGMKNCVEGFKKVVGYAEKKGVTINLEMLNSRVAENMKGHPGYQGDHTDYCIEILKKVGSPRLKLLFDIYHVQIMDGDVIQRIRQYKEYIGHVHTAGNPGRAELDDNQEINYPAIMRELVKAGYKDYVGQEFIPTREPLGGLVEAVKLCDV